MPNRILRDWTDSARFDGISAEAERLFVRLLMKADDFGRYHANPRLVKAHCYPLADDLRANTVAAWLTELSDRQLVFCYTSGTGSFLVIPRFRQRSRASASKFPPPDGKPPDWLPPDDGHMPVTRPPDDGHAAGNRQSPAHGGGDGGGGEDVPMCVPPGGSPREPAGKPPEGTHTQEKPIEPPPGFPKDIAEAVAQAEKAGVPADQAELLWNLAVGRGYRDAKGNQIRSWTHHAAAAWATQRSIAAQHHATNPANRGQRPDRNVGTTNAAIVNEFSNAPGIIRC